MTCREFVAFLIEYFSGMLPAGQRVQFEEHVAECDDCAAYLQNYRETIKLGKASFADPEEPVPDEVPEELVQAVLTARMRKA
ncbi:MAG: anti-sigma factor family protein [Candidatus Binatia bacterium]